MKPKVWVVFERFAFEMPIEAVRDCCHQGTRDADVAYWRDKIDLSHISDEALKAELREYAPWNDEELADRQNNEERIIWLAVGDIPDEEDE